MNKLYRRYKKWKNEKQLEYQLKENNKKKINFYSLFVKENSLCFDVGANIGNRVEPLLALKARVVAIEPQENCIIELERQFGDQIQIVKMGLGASVGIADFHISDASTLSSFSKDWIQSVQEDRFKNYSWKSEIKVPITTLDKLIELYGIPEFIKIDVEGYELEVLKGLSMPIRTISFEYTVPELLQSAKRGIEIIQNINPMIECNFSPDESMRLYFKQWLTPHEMLEFIDTTSFIDTTYGDIYCRTINY